MKNREKTFNGVIRAMEETENDKDRFLKAARLERHEVDRKYEMERLTLILESTFNTVALVGGMALIAFLFYLMTR